MAVSRRKSQSPFQGVRKLSSSTCAIFPFDTRHGRRFLHVLQFMESLSDSTYCHWHRVGGIPKRKQGVTRGPTAKISWIPIEFQKKEQGKVSLRHHRRATVLLLYTIVYQDRTRFKSDKAAPRLGSLYPLEFVFTRERAGLARWLTYQISGSSSRSQTPLCPPIIPLIYCIKALDSGAPFGALHPINTEQYEQSLTKPTRSPIDNEQPPLDTTLASSIRMT